MTSEFNDLLRYLTPQEIAEIDSHLEALSHNWRLTVGRRAPHAQQQRFLAHTAKRKVIRAGRRSGKTVGIGILARDKFLEGRRVLYAAPTEDQVETFWWEVKTAFAGAIDAGYVYKNETKHLIELPGTKTRIRAKTAFNAETLRGDYADLLILDEFQLMAEDTWGVVGAPMLADNDGDAIFIYTPPSLHSMARSKARDPRYAAALFQRAQADTTGRWAAFHFTSHDNPHISAAAVEALAEDMTALAYEQEILAEDKDDVPGALWTRAMIDPHRVQQMPALARVVIGVDPAGGAAETGVVVAGLGVDGDGYVLDDVSLQDSPEKWAAAVVKAYTDWEADWIIAEINFGGDMVKRTLQTVPGGLGARLKLVRATRGKAVRAEPISAHYEQGRVHHVGRFPRLEDELCYWIPGSGMPSPNRLDALVWALTELMKPRRVATSHQG